MNTDSDYYVSEFTNIELLNLIVEYISNYFKLENQSQIILYYDKEFNFKCVNKDTLDRISFLSFDELLNECNNINCDDELFKNKLDMINEINDTFNGNFFKEFSDIIWRKFKFICLES